MKKLAITALLSLLVSPAFAVDSLRFGIEADYSDKAQGKDHDFS